MANKIVHDILPTNDFKDIFHIINIDIPLIKFNFKVSYIFTNQLGIIAIIN